MTWSVVGATRSHTDNATFTTGSPTNVVVTPHASIASGDLVVASVGNRYDNQWSMGVTGGQTWNSLAQETRTTSTQVQIWWCVYNGTWAADPEFTPTTASKGCGIEMVGYRYSSAATITQDAAQVATNGSADPAVITGLTTGVDDALVVSALYISANYTFTIDTAGGWANPDLAQLRSLGTGSLATGWLNKATAGATGTLSQDSSSGGQWAAVMVSFKATATSSDVLVQGVQDLSRQFGPQTAARFGGFLQ